MGFWKHGSYRAFQVLIIDIHLDIDIYHFSKYNKTIDPILHIRVLNIFVKPFLRTTIFSLYIT